MNQRQSLCISTQVICFLTAGQDLLAQKLANAKLKFLHIELFKKQPKQFLAIQRLLGLHVPQSPTQQQSPIGKIEPCSSKAPRHCCPSEVSDSETPTVLQSDLSQANKLPGVSFSPPESSLVLLHFSVVASLLHACGKSQAVRDFPSHATISKHHLLNLLCVTVSPGHIFLLGQAPNPLNPLEKVSCTEIPGLQGQHSNLLSKIDKLLARLKKQRIRESST